MPSSSRPYQSKVLNFVLRQVQQGLERQQLAWRQLQSTAAWGAQIAIFPIYALVRAAEQAGFSLGNGAGESSETLAVEATADSAIATILIHTQQQLSPKQAAQVTLVTPDRENPHTSHTTQNSSRSPDPNHQVIHHAHHWLLGLLKEITGQPLDSSPDNQAITKTPPSGLATGTSNTQNAAAHDLAIGQDPFSIQSAFPPGLSPTGGTLASNLETRHLVLVSPTQQIFDIFTPKQQTDLKRYIFQVMTAYWQSRSVLRRRPHQRLSSRFQAPKLSESLPTPIATILGHTQTLLSPTQAEQLDLAPAGSIIRRAQRLLSHAIEHLSGQRTAIPPGASNVTSEPTAVAIALKGVSQLASSATTHLAVSLGIGHGLFQPLDQSGHTLASTLDTHQLVVVSSTNQIFDILTPSQQADLKGYIFRVMTAYWQACSSKAMGRPQSQQQIAYQQSKAQTTALGMGKVSLAFLPLGSLHRALPMGVKKAFSQLALLSRKHQKPRQSIRRLAPTSPLWRLGPSSPSSAQMATAGTSPAPEHKPDILEARVIFVSYLEHPLEIILRWLDRLLTWCEKLWQQWIAPRINLR